MSLIDDVIEHEGYEKKVYLDSLGKPTIGYGFLVESLELDIDICREILKRKLEQNELSLIRNLEFYRDLPRPVKDILQNMFYQLHYKLFKFKKTLRFIEDGDYKSASDEMLDSLWAKQTPRRASELSIRMSEVQNEQR